MIKKTHVHSLNNILNFWFILSIIFALYSCEEPNIVGLGVQPPDDELNVENTDSVTLITYTVKEDSIRTDETEFNLLGSNYDPVFGKNTASFYTQLRLSSNNADFGSNPVADSIILSLKYNSIYGDASTEQTVQVYELINSIFKDSAYYSNRDISTTGILLASNTFTPDATDSIYVDGIKKAPHLRIPLSAALAQKFINASGSTSLSDNTNFLEFFKGIYVTSLPVSDKGAILCFDLLNSISGITLYYHNDLADSLKYKFVINENNARFTHFDHSNFQYADPYLQSQIAGDTTKGDSLLYLQSMAGLKIKIKYPFIKDIFKSGRISINKATLIIPIEVNDLSLSENAPPPQLVLIEEKDGEIRFLADQYDGMTYFGGTYNSSTKEYRFNIGRHIQQVINGLKENIGLSLMVWTSSKPNIANRVVIKGAKQHSGKLRLQLTYTKLK
ncbi:MAG: DUF4270 domain-containing protein [Bacteroidetes bacterium]|nr:DUF4270 domain-containing protein [Bacteroidota bacterium]